jgi:hypothetical protein
VPNETAIIDVLIAIIRLVSEAANVLTNTSRPSSSVPAGWRSVGCERVFTKSIDKGSNRPSRGRSEPAANKATSQSRETYREIWFELI